MILKWEIEEDDVVKVISFFDKWKNDPFVKLREKRNLDLPRPEISKENVWRASIGCLLTTQQRSGPGSAVKRILDHTPFPLKYRECIKENNLANFAKEALNSFGGIRRIPTISNQIANNYLKLERGLWEPILRYAELTNKSHQPSLEREAAHYLSENLDGIGPKQSRNLLQSIGASKYEIPIDSRMIKWLNQNLLKFRLSANLLSDETYYDMVSDGIQELCTKAKIFPCMFDAAIFTSFDGGWQESDIGTSESLENA